MLELFFHCFHGAFQFHDLLLQRFLLVIPFEVVDFCFEELVFLSQH